MKQRQTLVKRWKWWFGGFALALATCAGFGTIAVRHLITQHSRPHGHGNITFDVSADGSSLRFGNNLTVAGG